MQSSATTTTPKATATVQTSTSNAAVVNNNDWLIGTWKVTEEKTGGQVKSGNKTTFVSYQFDKGGSGNYVERYDVMANQTQTKTMRWTLNGTSLKMSNTNYTLTPSADNRSMTISGAPGSSWKLSKQ